MRTKLNTDLLEKLYKEGFSYKEIIQKTGYNRNSVNGYFHRTKGKMVDTHKHRRITIPLTQEQKEILFGTLMGDGNIQKQKKNSYTGRFNHSIKQEKYLFHLKNVLHNITNDVRYYTTTVGNKEYKSCYFTLKGNTELAHFYEVFYQNGKRDVPLDLELLTPRAMAYWFMDDGTKSGGCSISIATCSFSFEGLNRLKTFLKGTYDIDIIIQKDFKIYFKAESGRKFYTLVKDYIIPEMMYKFEYIINSADLKLGELLETP